MKIDAKTLHGSALNVQAYILDNWFTLSGQFCRNCANILIFPFLNKALDNLTTFPIMVVDRAVLD